MFFCYIIVAGAAVFTDAAGTAEIIGEDNWILVSVINAITFSAGIYIVLAGVRMLIAEIVPAFKGISEKLVPNAASAGVCGNATGGLKGCVAGAFVHGIAVTFLAAGLMPVLGSFGFANTTFSDADFTIVGIVFGNLAKVMNTTALFGIILVLFVLPIVYNYTLGAKKNNE